MNSIRSTLGAEQTRSQRRSTVFFNLMLGGIGLVFLTTSVIVISLFKESLLNNEAAAQLRLAKVVSLTINRYFETLRVLTESAASSAIFKEAYSLEALALDKRFSRVNTRTAEKLKLRDGIQSFLVSPRSTKSNPGNSLTPPPHSRGTFLPFWQIYKGLPLFDENGRPLAKDRRAFTRNILKAHPDIHYGFQMDANGDLQFLEPFEVQKNITSFNYSFRDYLQLAKRLRSTAVSEGYISHDMNRTQIITVASPIFKDDGEIVGIFAISVSAATLRDRVFKTLRDSMGLRDETVFSLVDRHGHVVAASSGMNNYYPTEGALNDEQDSGNARYLKIFSELDWQDDVLEKGNIWERGTKSWIASSLPASKSSTYRNKKGELTIGTFTPVPLLGSDQFNWGVLVESKETQLFAARNQLTRDLIIANSIVILILLTLFLIANNRFSFLNNAIRDRELALSKLSAQVAHDIRAPVATLKSVVGASELDPGASELASFALERMSAIADELISSFKGRSNPSPPYLLGTDPTIGLSASASDLDGVRNTSLAFELRRLVSDYRHKSKNQGITVVFDENGVPDASLQISPVDFGRIVSNILDNATDALKQSNYRTVAIRVELKTENFATLIVNDSGVGLPSEHVNKVGVDGFSFGKNNGSGIGLAYTKETLMEIGGTFEFVSELGKGTCVALGFPLASEPISGTAHILTTGTAKATVAQLVKHGFKSV